MTRRILFVVLGVVVAILSGQAAGPPVADDPAAVALDQKLMSEAKKTSQIMANLKYLSDVIGPRLTGSKALERANNWTAEKMKSYGLTNVRLEAWTIPQGWERGKAVAWLKADGEPPRAITICAAGWSPGTKGRVEGEVVYLKANNMKELEEYKGKLKNAIVLLSPPSRVPSLDQIVGNTSAGGGGAKAGGKGFGKGGKGGKGKGGADGEPPAKGKGEPPDFTKGRPQTEFMSFRRDLNAFLAKEGAAAIFQDSRKPLNLLVTTGGWNRGGDRAAEGPRMPTLYCANNHYDLLYRMATRTDGPRPRLELEVDNKFIDGPVKVYNTVGEIRGSEKPDEFVVCGAHLDSWDLGTGTMDNGTGSCIVLETARLIASSGVKPKRTIRFVLFTGEEQGLHGSRVYVEQHKAEMARHSAAIVHDTGTGRVRGVGMGGWNDQRQIVERELASLRSVGVTDFAQRSGGGSDHMSFSRVGVPGLMFVQDMSTYSYVHHTQADTFDAAIEPHLIQGAQAMAVTAMRIANLNALLPRLPASNFGKGKGFGGE